MTRKPAATRPLSFHFAAGSGRKVKQKRRSPEAHLQKAVVQLLMFAAAPNVIWFHVPNGMVSNAGSVERMKEQGLLPGVADLVIVLPGGRVAFLELKAAMGRQRDGQAEFERRCATAGAPYRVARSFEAARQFLIEIGALRQHLRTCHKPAILWPGAVAEG